ncbi:hypothetical protein MUP37_06810 [Candidatus Bathyarchaeota archaeon]|nr:hypothetical protein [Candidatus Bathyarchaeota archaeon]
MIVVVDIPEKSSLEAALRECRRVLKKGGRLAITVRARRRAHLVARLAHAVLYF